MNAHTFRARSLWAIPLLLQVLLLFGCAGPAEQQGLTPGGSGYSSSDLGGTSTFPVPAEIRDNVDFWRHVYGVWGRGQVAIHDDEHLGVVYEVSRLPGVIENGYSESQKAWLDSRRSYYSSRLARLETKLREGDSLDRSEKELVAKFEKAGSRSDVFGASERVRTQRGTRERFRQGLQISGRYDKVFREIMRKYGVPEDLAYLPHVESSFQIKARSSAGAGGLWQFMPATGRSFMKVNDRLDERYDPILAADGAARYLAQAHRKLGSWPLAITSYNHGQGGMANAKAAHGRSIGKIVKNYKGRYFGFASRNYYAEFMAARDVAKNANRYFPEGVRYEAPWSYDRLVLQSSMPVYQLASHYGVSTGRLASLNQHWRNCVVNGDKDLPAGCTIWLPKGAKSRVAGQPKPFTRTIAAAPARASMTATPARSSAPRVAAATPTSVKATAQFDARPARAVAKPPQTTAKVAQKSTASSAKQVAQKTSSAKATKAVAKAKSSTTKVVVAKASPSKPSVAKTDTKKAKKAKEEKPKYYVVKPQQTLYRVALINGLSVAELRRLNKIHPQDNHIQPGQRLKVGI